MDGQADHAAVKVALQQLNKQLAANTTHESTREAHLKRVRKESRQRREQQQRPEADGLLFADEAENKKSSAEEENSRYTQYRPQQLKVGHRHPDLIVESAALAAVHAPRVFADLKPLEPDYEARRVSNAQLETVAYAMQRYFGPREAREARPGFFLGDGAGVGKGRQISALIKLLWAKGTRRILWLSHSNDLRADARRDMCDLHINVPSALGSQNKTKRPVIDVWPNGVAAPPQAKDIAKVLPEGVLFITYNMLRAGTKGVGKQAKTKGPIMNAEQEADDDDVSLKIDPRVKELFTKALKDKNARCAQIVEWLRGDKTGGFVVLDECHKAKNLLNSSGTPTLTGFAVMHLQASCPEACVLYSSATGMSEAQNMAYMTRVGTFGCGNMEHLINMLKNAGLGASELFSCSLKASGIYLARQLSYQGADFDLGSVELDPTFQVQYSRSAGMWQLLLEVTRSHALANKKRIGAMYAGSHQRFFRAMLMAAKVDTVAREAREAIADGHAVVVGLQSTGEANLERESANKEEFDELFSAPKVQLERIIDEYVGSRPKGDSDIPEMKRSLVQLVAAIVAHGEYLRVAGTCAEEATRLADMAAKHRTDRVEQKKAERRAARKEMHNRQQERAAARERGEGPAQEEAEDLEDSEAEEEVDDDDLEHDFSMLSCMSLSKVFTDFIASRDERDPLGQALQALVANNRFLAAWVDEVTQFELERQLIAAYEHADAEYKRRQRIWHEALSYQFRQDRERKQADVKEKLDKKRRELKDLEAAFARKGSALPAEAAELEDNDEAAKEDSVMIVSEDEEEEAAAEDEPVDDDDEDDFDEDGSPLPSSSTRRSIPRRAKSAATKRSTQILVDSDDEAGPSERVDETETGAEKLDMKWAVRRPRSSGAAPSPPEMPPPAPARKRPRERTASERALRTRVRAAKRIRTNFEEVAREGGLTLSQVEAGAKANQEAMSGINPEDLMCRECGNADDEADMMICDWCEQGMHTFCNRPRVDEIPGDGESWCCHHCVNLPDAKIWVGYTAACSEAQIEDDIMQTAITEMLDGVESSESEMEDDAEPGAGPGAGAAAPAAPVAVLDDDDDFEQAQPAQAAEQDNEDEEELVLASKKSSACAKSAAAAPAADDDDEADAPDDVNAAPEGSDDSAAKSKGAGKVLERSSSYKRVEEEVRAKGPDADLDRAAAMRGGAISASAVLAMAVTKNSKGKKKKKKKQTKVGDGVEGEGAAADPASAKVPKDGAQPAHEVLKGALAKKSATKAAVKDEAAAGKAEEAEDIKPLISLDASDEDLPPARTPEPEMTDIEFLAKRRRLQLEVDDLRKELKEVARELKRGLVADTEGDDDLSDDEDGAGSRGRRRRRRARSASGASSGASAVTVVDDDDEESDYAGSGDGDAMSDGSDDAEASEIWEQRWQSQSMKVSERQYDWHVTRMEPADPTKPAGKQVSARPPHPVIMMAKKVLAQQVLLLELPPNPLDNLVHLCGGRDVVAEMTGRKHMMVCQGDGKWRKVARREPGVRAEEVNLRERDMFMQGKKMIAIISDAASTGISLQAARNVPNKARRLHLTLELPWSADKAIQQFGRSHRSNQVSAPIYKLLMTPAAGEFRFASSAAKRLQSLGALLKGNRDALGAGQNLKAYDIDHKYGMSALSRFLAEVKGQKGPLGDTVNRDLPDATGKVRNIAVVQPTVPAPHIPKHLECVESFFNNWAYLDPEYHKELIKFYGCCKTWFVQANILDGDNVEGSAQDSKQAKSVKDFLNRLLGLNLQQQHLVFSYFEKLVDAEMTMAKAAGKFNQGVQFISKGVRQLERELVWQHPNPAKREAQVYRSRFSVDRGLSFEDAQELIADNHKQVESYGSHFPLSAVGFYKRKYEKNQLKTNQDFVCLFTAVPKHVGDGGKMGKCVVKRDPWNAGAQRKSVMDVRAHWVRISDEVVAKKRWNFWFDFFSKRCGCAEQPCKYVKADGHCNNFTRHQRLTILHGNLLPVWQHLMDIAASGYRDDEDDQDEAGGSAKYLKASKKETEIQMVSVDIMADHAAASASAPAGHPSRVTGMLLHKNLEARLISRLEGDQELLRRQMTGTRIREAEALGPLQSNGIAAGAMHAQDIMRELGTTPVDTKPAVVPKPEVVPKAEPQTAPVQPLRPSMSQAARASLPARPNKAPGAAQKARVDGSGVGGDAFFSDTKSEMDELAAARDRLLSHKKRKSNKSAS